MVFALFVYLKVLASHYQFDQGYTSCLTLVTLDSSRRRESVRILIVGVVVLVMLFGVGCGGESSEKDTSVGSSQEATRKVSSPLQAFEAISSIPRPIATHSL